MRSALLCLWVSWAYPRHLQEEGQEGQEVEWQARGGHLCTTGTSLLNETVKLRLCNCIATSTCAPGVALELAGLAQGSPNETSFLGAEIWASRRFQSAQVMSPADAERGASVHRVASNGVGLGSGAAGAFAGLSVFIGESGRAMLQWQDFIGSAPSTAFQTTEVSRVEACMMPPSRRLQDEGNETEGPPSVVYCGTETSVSPGRFKLSLYGYTWGKNWESSNEGQDYVFYQWRLCFHGTRTWYINQVRSGEGVLGSDEKVSVIDVQQDDGRPLTLWFPRYYMTGDHLECTFAANLVWELPNWECSNPSFGEVYVTAVSAGDACARDGVILNIGFPHEHLGMKDKWFLYTMEVNSTSTVTFASINDAVRVTSGLLLCAMAIILQI